MTGLVQVAGPIWLVVGEGRGRFPHSNSILIREAGTTAIVDTGCGVEALRRLRDEVDLVINTHTHPDHTAGNFLFPDREILVPEEGAGTAGDLRALSERFFAAGELQRSWRAFVREQMGFCDQRPTGTFRAGDELRVGATTLVALPMPGHTVDHYCFFVPEHGALLSADIDLTPFGPWYGHAESSLDQFRRSIEAARALDLRVVVSAHRPPVEGADIEPALIRFAGVLDERERRVRDFLREERSWGELVDAALIYGRFPYAVALMREWERQMVDKHVEELVASGRVARTAAGLRALG